jgi:hypothetical protein
MMLATSPKSHSLAKEEISVLARVHLLQMLLKIIEPRPHLVVLRATISKALIVLTFAMLWLDTMDTLLVPLKVIDVGEALCPP